MHVTSRFDRPSKRNADDGVADVLDGVADAVTTDGMPVVNDGVLVGWLAPADLLRAATT